MIKILLNSLRDEHQVVKDKMELITKVEFSKLHADLLRDSFNATKMKLDQCQNIFDEVSDKIEELEKQREEDAYDGAYFNRSSELEFLKQLRG